MKTAEAVPGDIRPTRPLSQATRPSSAITRPKKTMRLPKTSCSTVGVDSVNQATTAVTARPPAIQA